MKERVVYFLLRELLVTTLLIITSLISISQSRYVKQYKSLSDSLSAEYGIPRSVILGVAIIESGRGTSRNCRLLNNHFGIEGKNNLLRSKKIRTRYKQYPNGRASYIDFCNLISRKRFYKKLKGNRNYSLWLSAISKAGYSETPFAWKQRITSTIKKNKLF